MPRERPMEGSWAAAILLLPEKGTVGGATRAQSPGRGVSVVQSASPPSAQAVRRWPQRTLGYNNACSLHPPASALTPEKSEPQSEWGEEREVEGERSWFFPARFYLLLCRPGLGRGWVRAWA